MGKNSCVVKAESMRNTSNSGKKLYISEIRKWSSLGIIEKIHSMLENQEIFNSAILWNNGDLDASAFHEVVIKGDLKKYVQVLAERLHLNLEQALFIPFFVKNLDEAQDYRDISRYFNCIETYRIIEHSETLESLAALGYINIETNYRNEICFRMPASVVQYIVQ